MKETKKCVLLDCESQDNVLLTSTSPAAWWQALSIDSAQEILWKYFNNSGKLSIEQFTDRVL